MARSKTGSKDTATPVKERIGRSAQKALLKLDPQGTLIDPKKAADPPGTVRIRFQKLHTVAAISQAHAWEPGRQTVLALNENILKANLTDVALERVMAESLVLAVSHRVDTDLVSKNLRGFPDKKAREELLDARKQYARAKKRNETLPESALPEWMRTEPQNSPWQLFIAGEKPRKIKAAMKKYEADLVRSVIGDPNSGTNQHAVKAIEKFERKQHNPLQHAVLAWLDRISRSPALTLVYRWVPVGVAIRALPEPVRNMFTGRESIRDHVSPDPAKGDLMISHAEATEQSDTPERTPIPSRDGKGHGRDHHVSQMPLPLGREQVYTPLLG